MAPKCRQAEWLQVMMKSMFRAQTDIALGNRPSRDERERAELFKAITALTHDLSSGEFS